MRAHGYLPRGLVKGDGLERILVIVVYRLYKRVWLAEDGKGIAGDVSL